MPEGGRGFAPSPRDVLPTAEGVAAFMGYGPGRMPEYFDALVRRSLGEAALLMEVRGIFVEANAECDARGQGIIRLNGRAFNVGQRIAERLGPLRLVAVFACTVGPGLGARARDLMGKDEGLEAYVYDAIASLAAENAAEALQRSAEEEAGERGLGATERYSPGYCGWPVSEQARLFALLPPGACGIRLTESSMMVPEKSVSGIFGLGPGLSRRGYGCGQCDRESCPSRAGKGE